MTASPLLPTSRQVDIAIVGAGAAGLMAGIWTARAAPHAQVAVLDGALKLGAKILVAGGGRCNVTHDEVSADAFAGSSRNAIKKVLRRFDVPQTVAFFAELGVRLKREETGKLFPTTDKARSVLEALLTALKESGGSVYHPCRVGQVQHDGDGYQLSGEWGSLYTSRLILATGGRSLPKTGSDGGGYGLAQSLGHSLTAQIFPALVPLTLPADHFICALSGISVPAALTVCSSTGRRLVSFTDSTLCTHFGLSGPSVLDISRYYTELKQADPGASLLINWLPHLPAKHVEADLLALGSTPILRYLVRALPDRLARAICQQAALSAATPGDRLTRDKRKSLLDALTASPLPISGDRGFNYAEVTAGGVPLAELRLESMESRVSPGLYLCGELCDVDGRIGGYNFQWAWASGYVAGISASSAVKSL